MSDFAHGEQSEEQEKLQRSAVAVASQPELAAEQAPVPVGGLLVGSADDPLEAAADRAADAALSRIRRLAAPGADGPRSHRHGRGCGHVDIHRVATPTASPRIGMAGGALDGATNTKINSMRSSGQPLSGDLRTSMESAFRTPLDRLRIHTGPEAATISRQISAKAFTTGNDIFFGEGQFQPESEAGAHTLAHEIAHTLQPGGGAHRLVDASLTIRRDDEGTEAEAEDPGPANMSSSEIVSAVEGYDQSKKNWGIGNATKTQTLKAGKEFCGGRTAVDKGRFGFMSADGLRQFRAPSEKPKLGLTQANFETRSKPSGAWEFNGHVTVAAAK